MKKFFIALGLVVTLSLVGSSCEEFDSCDWYVYDADGILTGYQDKETCQEWASMWSDVTCTCK